MIFSDQEVLFGGFFKNGEFGVFCEVMVFLSKVFIERKVCFHFRG